MPGPFGVTATGFNRPTLQEVLERIESRQLATIDPELDISTESPLGQLNGILAREFSLLWEQAESIYHSNDPDRAEDAALVAIAKLTGTEKRAASYSEVDMTIGADIGTVLLAGTHFVEHEDFAGVRFTPLDDFTAPSTGSHINIRFRAENTGPVSAANGKLTVIATPVTGWNSATNPQDATPGRDVDTDPILRTRREQQIASAGSSTLDAIVADLLDIDEITSVLPFENVTDTIDANGLPPHSFEMVIWDGDPAEADDDEIAQVIFDNKAAGIRSFGTVSGTAVDANEDDQTVYFSRATARNIYLEFDLTTGPDFDADDFKLAVVTAADEIFGVSNSILATRLIAIAWTQPNVTNVVSVKLGFTVVPTLSVDLTIGAREIGRFDTTRVTLT
jgi:hypothetical protein